MPDNLLPHADLPCADHLQADQPHVTAFPTTASLGPTGVETVPEQPLLIAQTSDPIITSLHETASGATQSLGNVAIATLISRITGFIRILCIAIFIISPAIRSAFSFANALPNQIAALILEAVLTSVVTPLMCQAENEDADRGKNFFNHLFTLSTIILSVGFIISCIAVPWFIPWQTSHQTSDNLAEIFSYLLLPQIIFYGLCSLFSSMLNVRGQFILPAWAPVVNNIIAITAIIISYEIPGSFTGTYGWYKTLVLCGGSTLGVAVQTMMLVPALRKLHVQPRFSFGIDARLRKFAWQALSIFCYVLISQLGLYLTFPLASAASANGIFTYLTTWQFLQVPYGVVGLSILTTATPTLSRYASKSSFSQLRNYYRHVSLLSMILLWPCIAVLTVFGKEITQSLLGIHSANAHDIGLAITWSAITIIPYAFVLLQLRIFYALNYAWTPIIIITVITVSRIIFNYCGGYFLPSSYVVAWLGLSNGLSFACGAIIGASLLRSILRGPSAKKGDFRRGVFFAVLSFCIANAIKLGCYALPLLPTDNRIVLCGITVLGCALSFIGIFGVFRLARFVVSLSPQVILRQGFSAIFPSDIDNLDNGSAGDGNYTNAPVSNISSDRDSYRSQEDVKSSAKINKNIHTVHNNAVDLLQQSKVSLIRYIGGDHLNIEFWQGHDNKLHRDIGIIISPMSEHLSQHLLEIEKYAAHCVAKIYNEIVCSTTDRQYCISQWIEGKFLWEVTNENWPIEHIFHAIKDLTLAIKISHLHNTPIGLGDPLNIRISYSRKAVLICPLPHHYASFNRDIQGLAAIIYTLLTKSWPMNIVAPASWPYKNPSNAPALSLTVAESHPTLSRSTPDYTSCNFSDTSYQQSPAQLSIDPQLISWLAPSSCILAKQFDKIVCTAIMEPNNIENTANLIDVILHNDHELTGDILLNSTTPNISALSPTSHVSAGGSSIKKFTAPNAAKKSQWPFISGSVIGIFIFLITISLMAAFSFGSYEFNDTINGINELVNVPRTTETVPQKITFTPIKIVDFSGKPTTVDTKYLKFLPNLVTGAYPSWRTDNYRYPDVKTTKVTSDGIGIVLQIVAPQPLQSVHIQSPSKGAEVTVYNYTPEASSIDTLTPLSYTVTLTNFFSNIHTKPYQDKYILIWITKLAYSHKTYNMIVKKISLT